jgi:hypothetical protein
VSLWQLNKGNGSILVEVCCTTVIIFSRVFAMLHQGDVQFDGFPQETEKKMVYHINHDVDVLSDASDDTLRQSHKGMCKSKLAVDSHFSTW